MRLGLTVLSLLLIAGPAFAQDGQRVVVEVPYAEHGSITLDGVMDEAAWNDAGEANLVTATGYEFFGNKYGREALLEPEYDEYYARMLWSPETLWVFIHIDEFVNDSTNLFWAGQWTGDQLFVSLSARLGEEMKGWYDGNVYRAPEGPYHFLILGEDVTLNNENSTYIPEEFRCTPADSEKVFEASEVAEWAVTIDTTTGVWNIEMAIHNPHVNAQSHLGFNIGGSIGSRHFHNWSIENWGYSDSYAYYTWQPNVPNDPYAVPDNAGNGSDAGFDNLASSANWAMLKFTPQPAAVSLRKELTIPRVNPDFIAIDGVMAEDEWGSAGEANLITATGYEFFANKYGRESLLEPEFDEYYARLLWSPETLWVFIHMDEFVNDSTNLFWAGQWTGDQLFVSLSARLGEEMKGWYDGNVYRAPEGPYHFLILGEDVTLHAENSTYIPEEFRCTFVDSEKVFLASEVAEWAVMIDTTTGVWDIEMAIHNPNVNALAALGFNIGGSMGSRHFHNWSIENWGYSDSYGYYTWQPNVPNDPYAVPDNAGNGSDAGFDNLASSANWAVLYFDSDFATALPDVRPGEGIPTAFMLEQNYPNPFNPKTTIRFTITETAPVTVNVYNTVGQVVATLLDNRQTAAGTYTLTWDAGHLASGVYFYELIANGTRQTKKMVLMK